MAKLLITLDGVQVGEREVDKERITIGRRPHNDIVLDHIGVSGEHAAVVTILNDSFLEDMGSTNGTLINGAPARKHFLRNGDLIEIGRHRMRFVGEVAGTREAADYEKTMVLNRPSTLPRAPATGDVRTATVDAWKISEPVEAAQPQPEMAEVAPAAALNHIEAQAQADAAAIAALPAEASAEQQVELLAASMAQYLPATASVAAQPVSATPTAGHSEPAAFPDLAGIPEALPADANATGYGASRPDSSESSLAAAHDAVRETAAHHQIQPVAVPELPLASRETAAGSDVLAAVAASALPQSAARNHETMARLQVLNGTAAGRILEITKPLTTIGRPAVQVAVISRRSDGFYLAQVDGDQPARLNGTPLVPHAVALHAHDVLEIAGVKLEFFFQA